MLLNSTDNYTLKPVGMYDGMKAIAEGYYVADTGEIYSDKSSFKRIMDGTPDTQGLLRVGFCVDGHYFKKYIHQIVAMAYVKNHHGYAHVRHINSNVWDNHPFNLEWVQRKPVYTDKVTIRVR